MTLSIITPTVIRDQFSTKDAVNVFNLVDQTFNIDNVSGPHFIGGDATFGYLRDNALQNGSSPDNICFVYILVTPNKDFEFNLSTFKTALGEPNLLFGGSRIVADVNTEHSIWFMHVTKPV